jgi:hypothetical protein
MNLQRAREWLVLLLIAALPFHALLVTVGTKLILGPGHVPLPYLAVWKEVFLGIILFLCGLEFLLSSRRVLRLDTVDLLMLALLLLALAIPTSNFAYGFKYDLFPLVLFLILRRVPWSEEFQQRLSRLLLKVGAAVAAYGIVSFFLPQGFFTALGYSDLHSLYLPDSPLAPFQLLEEGGVRRIQGTMSGPNQLGMWLLIPFGTLIPAAAKGRAKFFVTLVVIVALFLTFSRAAWIAAMAMLIVVFWGRIRGEAVQRYRLRGLLLMIVILSTAFILAPEIFLRTLSTREHFQRPLEAIEIIMKHPLGLGLGTAGPASNRVSDPCVYLPAGADASWAKDRMDLCVFVGEQQTQPTDRACQCPLLPENWYLQIGVELGLIGLVLFVALTVLVLLKLRATSYQLSAFLSFLGISTASLFLHAWEDSAVAYTMWLLLVVALSVVQFRRAQ